MTRKNREDNVKKFMTQEKCRILVISLKSVLPSPSFLSFVRARADRPLSFLSLFFRCGGVGLNLTRANRQCSSSIGEVLRVCSSLTRRVSSLPNLSFLPPPGIINMDLAWNAATEEQALDRVHRIGKSPCE